MPCADAYIKLQIVSVTKVFCDEHRTVIYSVCIRDDTKGSYTIWGIISYVTTSTAVVDGSPMLV